MSHANNYPTNSANCKLQRGFLITIEGIDGAGKSSLLTILINLLQAQNLPVKLTQEPGGTPLGQKLRQILQTGELSICAKAEYLLFAADRAEHFEKIIIPQLQLNQIIISDRMADSSLVYQGYGRGLELAKIKFINQWAMNNITPDLVLYLRLDPATAYHRITQRAQISKTELSSFEKEQADFMKKIAHGFDQIFNFDQVITNNLSNNNSTKILTLDGTQTSAELAAQAYARILELINV